MLGQAGHGDVVRTVADGAPDQPVGAVLLMLCEGAQQLLHLTPTVPVGAGVWQQVHQPVGGVGDAPLARLEGHGGPAGGADVGPCDAQGADEVPVPAALHGGRADGVQADGALQGGLLGGDLLLDVRQQLQVGLSRQFLLSVNINIFILSKLFKPLNTVHMSHDFQIA